MNMQKNKIANGDERQSDQSTKSKRRVFGAGFWLVLFAGLIITTAISVEFVQPGILRRMAGDISGATQQGLRQLIIVLFWKVVVPAYFIFYTALPIALFYVIRKMRLRIAALEERK